ncbi:MAG: hypothetical protein R2856_08525 [Caldilineaceae bacterium]
MQIFARNDDEGQLSGTVDVDLTPGVWQEYIIPVSGLTGITSIKRIDIQEGAAQPTFIIDNLRLVGNCTQETSYLDIRAAIGSDSTELANQDTMPHMLLAQMAMIAYWASVNGDDSIDWNAVNWADVNWNSVNWNSVNWNSVNWNSVNWNSVNWNSVN